jgi:predicted phage terminase large subunit-like protein
MKLRPTRAEREEYLALLEEKARRVERRRVFEEREAIIAKCSTLHGFIEEFWSVLEPVAPFKTGWALRAMCAHLEAVTAGFIKRLLMTVPPGMMKSLLLVFWTAWEWGPKGMPHIQVLATSYSQANAHRDNMKLRDLVKSEKFQTLWPLAIREDQDAKGKFINTRSGFSEARPFSKMTGGRANRVKIDDPHDTESAESDVERAKAVRIMREAISDRVNDPVNDAIVLIMQRLHSKDCAATAIELGYVHLNLPMEFEPDRKCVTVLRPANDGNPAILFEDPRTHAGQLLFPERFPAPEVEKLKKAKGSYAWAGQYQQRPAPREGGLFKRMWFQVVGAVPIGAQRVRKWDLAASTEATSTDPDWTVGVLMARDVEGFIYVENVIRFRGTPAEVERAIVNTATMDANRYGVVRIGLNQDPGQAGKAQVEYLTRKLLGYTVESERETGSKEVRAAPFAAQAEAGNVRIVAGDWNEEFLSELEVFPAGGHDDQVDAASGACSMLAGMSIATWAKLAS